MADPAPARAVRGPGRVLALTYGFFALAAGARSSVQLATRPGDALLAYSLSLAAALVYASGTWLLLRADRGRARGPATVSCLVELTGLVLVGSLSTLRPDLFPDQTVWSGFGRGYGFVPAVLPVLALVWLRGGVRAGWPPAPRLPRRPLSGPGPRCPRPRRARR